MLDLPEPEPKCGTSRIARDCKKLTVVISVAAKGDTEPERNETRNKVDEDRKHEYP